MAKHKYYVTSSPGGPATGNIESLYTAIFSDAIARHKRMTGFDVAHFIDSDACSEQPGQEKGQGRVEDLTQLADVRPTHFADPSSTARTRAVHSVLRSMLRRSWSSIYKGNYEGRYCYLDQIDISDSSQPALCSVCGLPGELVSEERYFFRLSAFQGRLQAIYKYRPQLLQPGSRRQRVEQFIGSELKDISISRRAGNGVPWPDDPEQVAQNYFSNLVSYLGALGFAKEGHADDFARFWPADLHVINKAEVLQHAVYWPAFLMAADMRVPRHIFAHGALLFEQQSRDAALLRKFSGQFGTDALRYCLLREVPYDPDARFSFERFATRYDTEIVQGYGNLASKILKFVARCFDGKIPVPAVTGNFDPGIEKAVADTRRAVGFLFEHYDVNEGLNRVQGLITHIGNALTELGPDRPGQDAGNGSQLRPLIHDACQALAIITMFLHPVVPNVTCAVWKSLGRPTRLQDQIIDQTPWGILRPGTPIGPIEETFPPSHKPRTSSA